MKNYRKEKEHDTLLIQLTKELDQVGRIDILEGTFGIASLGRLQRARRGQLFDVELTFSGASLAVETKVDSDEAGRWQPHWQTERTWQTARRPTPITQFLFVTYGTAEFYTKPPTKAYQAGPASPNFTHIGLDTMTDFVQATIQLSLPSANLFQDWLSAMQIEREKRTRAADLLEAFSHFRRNYLLIARDLDFPNSRLTFRAPELAFPVFHNLASLWNAEKAFYGKHGRVAVYPVPRSSPQLHDSILNFYELWRGDMERVGSALPLISNESLYFEINEDFNLNLKLEASSLRASVRDEVHRRLQRVANWPCDIKGKQQEYKQKVFVLYEWDFGFLDNVRDPRRTAGRLASILDLARQTLA